MTQDLLKRLALVEKEISDDKGAFTLFAIVLRPEMTFVGTSDVIGTDDTIGTERWDVVAAAPWLLDTRDTMHYFAAKISAKLKSNEYSILGRILVLPQDDKFVRWLNEHYPVGHSLKPISREDLTGLGLYGGYVVTSKRPRRNLVQAAP